MNHRPLASTVSWLAFRIAPAIALSLSLTPSAHAYSSSDLAGIQVGIQIPFFSAPGLTSTTPPPVGSLGSLGNVFGDIFERFGLYVGYFPVNKSPLRVGTILDVAWHYDIDFNKTPSISGFHHLGLGASTILDLGTNVFIRTTAGINRMGNRVGNDTTYGTGSLLEGGMGYRAGALGHGIMVEALFQNRTGLSTMRFGLLRLSVQI